MPLSYGEGDDAFRRLQEEALKKDQDLSILVWGFEMTWQETAAQLRYPNSRLTNPLAASVRFFKNFPWLVVNYPLLRPTTHFMVTNMGLNISLPLIRIDSSLGVCLAFLSVSGLRSTGIGITEAKGSKICKPF